MKIKPEPVESKGYFLQSLRFLDVASLLDSTVSVKVDVFRKVRSTFNPFAGRESALHVQITNAGEKDLNDLLIEAFACEGLQLVDPGALFGSGRRHVRLPALRPKKSITYKLALRVHPEFVSGDITIVVKSALWDSAGSEFIAKVNVKVA